MVLQSYSIQCFYHIKHYCKKKYNELNGISFNEYKEQQDLLIKVLIDSKKEIVASKNELIAEKDKNMKDNKISNLEQFSTLSTATILNTDCIWPSLVRIKNRYWKSSIFFSSQIGRAHV